MWMETCMHLCLSNSLQNSFSHKDGFVMSGMFSWDQIDDIDKEITGHAKPLTLGNNLQPCDKWSDWSLNEDRSTKDKATDTNDRNGRNTHEIRWSGASSWFWNCLTLKPKGKVICLTKILPQCSSTPMHWMWFQPKMHFCGDQAEQKSLFQQPDLLRALKHKRLQMSSCQSWLTTNHNESGHLVISVQHDMHFLWNERMSNDCLPQQTWTKLQNDVQEHLCNVNSHALWAEENDLSTLMGNCQWHRTLTGFPSALPPWSKLEGNWMHWWLATVLCGLLPRNVGTFVSYHIALTDAPPFDWLDQNNKVPLTVHFPTSSSVNVSGTPWFHFVKATKIVFIVGWSLPARKMMWWRLATSTSVHCGTVYLEG